MPRATKIGIPDAPSQLPDPGDLHTYPLRVCSSAPWQGQRYTTVQIGTVVQGEIGRAPTSTTALAIRDDRGNDWLLYQGRRFRAERYGHESRARVLTALGFLDSLPAGQAWLSAIPAGPDLAPLAIPGRGQPSANAVPGQPSTVGALMYLNSAAGRRYFVLLPDGLAEISPLDNVLLETDRGVHSTEISVTDYNAHASPSTSGRLGNPEMPTDLPAPDSGVGDLASASVCATWDNASAAPAFAVGVPTPAADHQAADPMQADGVEMPALFGALVEARSPGHTHGATLLITDGRKYPIADADAQAALGYGDRKPDLVDQGILALIPPGLAGGESLSVPQALQAH